MAPDDTTHIAVWFEDGQCGVRNDLPVPVPGPGEVLVRTRLAGICGTDLQLLAGYAGFRGVPGHEFVGEVVAGPGEWLGRRIVASINVGCGNCRECPATPEHCERRRVLGIRDMAGAFATFVSVPATNLHAVADHLTDEAAVFAEPLAAACRAVRQLGELADRRVLLLGAGRLGQLVARVLALQPCVLTVATRSARKRALLPDAVTAIDPEAVPHRAFDIAIDCTGVAAGAEAARVALRPRGTLLIKSTQVGAPEFDLNAVVVDELQVLGSRCGRLEEALGLLVRGDVDPRPLIDATMPLREAIAALAVATAPGALKVLLVP